MKTITVKSHAELNALVAENVFRYTKPWTFSPTLYSTDIAAAFQVVEKMRLKKIHSTVAAYGIDQDQWFCESFTDEPSKLWSKAAPTAPLAICLCALASAGIDVILEIP